MTACIRNLFYMAQDVKNLFWPSQLTAVVRGRDYDHAVKKAADVLVEAEAEVDSLEPAVPRCTDACSEMHRFEPGCILSTVSAVPGPADPSPAPEGDDAPMADSDIPPSPAMGATNLADLIAEVLEKHTPVWSAPAFCFCGGWSDSGPLGARVRHNYREHVAELIAERIENQVATP